MLDSNFYARRRNQACYFWISRISIGIAIITLLCLQVWFIFQIRGMIEDDRVNARGGNIQVLVDNTAGEALSSGSVVSYDADGTILPGLGVTQLPLALDSTTGLECSNAEILAGRCFWKTHQDGEVVVQFRLSTISGVFPNQLDISHFDATTQTATFTTPTLNISSVLPETPSTVQSITILEAAASTLPSTSTGTATSSSEGSAVILYSETLIGNSTEVQQQYILASHNPGVADSSVLQSLATISKGDYDLAASSTGPRAFIHYLPAGLLVGVQCGLEQCCVALLDVSDPSLPPLVERVFPDTNCPKVVALLGMSYVAFGLSPIVVIRAFRSGTSGTPYLIVHQVFHLPWGGGDETAGLSSSGGTLNNILTVPSSHPYARFVVVSAMDGLIRCFYLLPKDVTALDSLSLTSTVFNLQQGIMQTTATAGVGGVADGLSVAVRAAVFVPPKLEIQVIVQVGASLKFLGRLSLEYTVCSELIALDSVPGQTTAQMLLYASSGSSGGNVMSVVPGETAVASNAMLTTITWYGGYSLAGISQNSAKVGELVVVLRGGASHTHRELIPGRKYQSGEGGILVPYRGGPMLSDDTWAAAGSGIGGSAGLAGGYPPHYGTSSNYLVVGVAESTSKLRVFLR